MTKRLLVCDIGNTQIVFGLYHGKTLRGQWRLSSQHAMTADELAWQMRGMFQELEQDPQEVSGIMVASVVPRADRVLADACQRICGRQPAFIGSPDVKTGMAVDYKNPREVGADRIANAVAARASFGSPVIVLDCGTATTFDIVSPEGHYAGGLILPGMEISLEALVARAAKLPSVPLAALPFAIGRDTTSSMQLGSYWGTVEALRGLIGRLRKLNGHASTPVVATGGLAPMLVPQIPEISAHVPELTLQGLMLLGHRHFQH
ncbi:MAG: type III pantothenate kinase [Zetaproteobacteria bacterium]|nr:MAG: type III pantothenate kinase [Zetaproteobacteria bacterium]